MTAIIPLGIRWDAWYTDTVHGYEMRNSLSPQKWQYRAPIHCPSTGPFSLKPFSISQAIIDAEISAATGIINWTFLQYGSNYMPDLKHTMMLAMAQYRQSSIKGQISYTTLAQPQFMGSSGNYAAYVALQLSWFSEPNYLKVGGGRPVLPILYSGSYGGYANAADFKTMVDALRAACVSAGLGTPYIVVMNGSAFAAAIGADALSDYSIGPPTGIVGVPYATLDTAVQARWAFVAALAATLTSASSGLPLQYCPTIMTGLDPRPIVERPPGGGYGASYSVSQGEATGSQYALSGDDFYVIPPTSAQLTAHVQAAGAFCDANATNCPFRLVFAYACTEHSENGNTLAITNGDPTGTRLAAFKAGLPS